MIVCKIPLLARALGQARATIGYLVYNLYEGKLDRSPEFQKSPCKKFWKISIQKSSSTHNQIAIVFNEGEAKLLKVYGASLAFQEIPNIELGRLFNSDDKICAFRLKLMTKFHSYQV